MRGRFHETGSSTGVSRHQRAFGPGLLVLTLTLLVSFKGLAPGGVVSEFDGDRAYEHLRSVVELGPRPLGSEALEKTRVYIEDKLKQYGLTPLRHEFVAKTPIGEVPMANIVAELAAADGERATPVLLLASHFDTKLFEGFEFLGANDGGSSTGVLLELARVLVAQPLELPIRLVFFDGEESVGEWSDEDSTYGSRNMAARLASESRLSEIGALVLLDMIGDAELQLKRDMNSTLWLTDLIWSSAAELGYAEHFIDDVTWIADDHVPFIERGVPAVDLIDLDYGPGRRYWHTPMDTIDKVSAKSLKIVGDTVLTALPSIIDRVLSVTR